MTWEEIQREMPGQILCGQQPEKTGKIYSVFYNMDATWTIFESTRESRTEADIREVGTYNQYQIRQALRGLGFREPLEWQDRENLQLPFEDEDEDFHFKDGRTIRH
jgi:hypothetical protein